MDLAEGGLFFIENKFTKQKIFVDLDLCYYSSDCRFDIVAVVAAVTIFD